MKYVYKFTTWLLFEIITGIIAFNCGIMYLGKIQKKMQNRIRLRLSRKQ